MPCVILFALWTEKWCCRRWMNVLGICFPVEYPLRRFAEFSWSLWQWRDHNDCITVLTVDFNLEFEFLVIEISINFEVNQATGSGALLVNVSSYWQNLKPFLMRMLIFVHSSSLIFHIWKHTLVCVFCTCGLHSIHNAAQQFCLFLSKRNGNVFFNWYDD